ncbi:MAG: L-rhamnose isomerase [Lentisphaerae bacterium ADurb.Bin242]|nr:MAG: L-rhamnose isomerase [Lentisphaerae bacterium ADurb.Bin242]
MGAIEKSYLAAKEQYASAGVDTDSVLERLRKVSLCIHAWQGDDVVGFENTDHPLTGGCQVTGNYPGRARTADELRKDLDAALRLIPGKHRVGLQGHQVDRMFPGVDRDAYTIENFSSWLDWAKSRRIGMDIAPAFYSHPKLDHGLSLSHPDRAVRKFWIDHGIACRKIGAAFGKALGTPAVCNFWAPDGFKDIPGDRFSPRLRLMKSLEECFAEKISPKLERDAVESKLFGIGTESCTVGSHEFYMLFAAKHNKMLCLDTGHFHPTESVADKLSAIFCMMDELLLHVSRGVRWDSDHVLVLNDELLAIGREASVYGCLDKIHISLDYFDASINRIAAWVIGSRNMQKALLIGMLEPQDIREYEKKWNFTARLAAEESAKTLPWGDVWRCFCLKNDVPQDTDFMREINAYEKKVLAVRK